jgi:hypothetical protein
MEEDATHRQWGQCDHFTKNARPRNRLASWPKGIDRQNERWQSWPSNLQPCDPKLRTLRLAETTGKWSLVDARSAAKWPKGPFSRFEETSE